jgi:hypothetical protein
MPCHLEEEFVDARTLGDVDVVHDVLDLVVFESEGKKEGKKKACMGVKRGRGTGGGACEE